MYISCTSSLRHTENMVIDVSLDATLRIQIPASLVKHQALYALLWNYIFLSYDVCYIVVCPKCS